MDNSEKEYLSALKLILETGEKRVNRTGVDSLSLFGLSLRFNLEQGFPALTTKKLAWKSVVSELLWFIEGSGDEFRLRELLHGNRYSEKGTIGLIMLRLPIGLPKGYKDIPVILVEYMVFNGEDGVNH